MTEYRVWHETGDLVLVTTDRDQAELEWIHQIETCPCDEADCGVFSPHGYSIQTVKDN